MLDAGLVRLGRELFMATLGMPIHEIEPWVLDRLTALLEEQQVRAGEVLYRAGEPADSFFFMQDGQVRVTRGKGQSWVMRGRWAVGALEAVLDAPRTGTTTALSDFQAMRVEAGPWVELLEDSFQLARGAVVNSGQATARLEERIPELPSRADGAPRWTVGPGALSLVERLALLVDVRMLGGAGVQSLVDLAAATEESRFEAGARVLEPGLERRDLMLVVDGAVRASRERPGVVRSYGPGDILLGAASFGATAPAWEAVATTTTRVLSFPIEVWFDLMEEHFDLVRSTLAALAARRDLLLEHLADGTRELVLT